MKLAVGSYERFLWAWRLDYNDTKLVPVFTCPAHLGPIKCASSWGTTVVTGGADDTIRVFDVRRQSSKDIGILLQVHTGAITTLQLFADESLASEPTHLFSGSEDGTVCIWDADSWVHLKSLPGKVPINDLSIHPTGRLGLSIDRTGHMKMWNLLKGRCSFTTKLPQEASLIKFTPGSGDSYSLASNDVVELHNAEDGKVLQSFRHDKKVLCIAPYKDKILFTGGEDRAVNAWDFRCGKMIHSIANAHSSRIKGLAVLGIPTAADASADSYYVASASSDGFVRVWDRRMIQEVESSSTTSKQVAVMEVETKARLTCIVSCATAKERGISNAATATAAAVAKRNVAEEEEKKEKTPDEEDNLKRKKQKMVLMKKKKKKLPMKLKEESKKKALRVQRNTKIFKKRSSNKV